MNINCTIRVFFDCLAGDYSRLPGGAPAFTQLFHGFMQLSYLQQFVFEQAKFEKVKLEGELKFLTIQIGLNKENYRRTEEPFLPALNTLRDKGYPITFDASHDQEFLPALSVLQNKISDELQPQIDALDSFMQHITENGLPLDHFPVSYFVKNINLLRNKGFEIDSNTTTVKELALIIRGPE